MGLATKPKNVQVKEVNQEGVLHIHQQEYLKIRRQMPIVRDMLRHGELKLIKEVLEVPTARLDADMQPCGSHCCILSYDEVL